VTSQEQREATKDRDELNDVFHERTKVFREIAALLETWRLENRKRPFQGFNSPPGRF
jgi:hypothetical protein